MFEPTFRSGSPLHLLCLVICALCVAGYGILAHQYRDGRDGRDGRHRWLPGVLAAACITAWTLNTIGALTSKYFSWETSLPLYYCNWANLLGAAVALTRNRTVDALLYYWACGLTIWAFITPTLQLGPGTIGFWIFWGYHLCIALAVCHLLVAIRFRPDIADWLKASAITIAYGLLLVPVNMYWGWNYAFLGESKPKAPTPIDALGSWPLRLIWIALLAVAVFYLLTLPWLLSKKWRASPAKFRSGDF